MFSSSDAFNASAERQLGGGRIGPLAYQWMQASRRHLRSGTTSHHHRHDSNDKERGGSGGGNHTIVHADDSASSKTAGIPPPQGGFPSPASSFSNISSISKHQGQTSSSSSSRLTLKSVLLVGHDDVRGPIIVDQQPREYLKRSTFDNFGGLFVPKAELKRIPTWFFASRTTTLVLLYAEELKGDRYDRHVLHYTIAFAFETAEPFPHLRPSLAEYELAPHVVAIANIAEELRRIERQWGWVDWAITDRRLRGDRPPPPPPSMQSSSQSHSKLQPSQQQKQSTAVSDAFGPMETSDSSSVSLLLRSTTTATSESATQPAASPAASGQYASPKTLLPSGGSGSGGGGGGGGGLQATGAGTWAPVERALKQIFDCMNGQRGAVVRLSPFCLFHATPTAAQLTVQACSGHHIPHRIAPLLSAMPSSSSSPNPAANASPFGMTTAPDLVVTEVYAHVDGRSSIDAIARRLGVARDTVAEALEYLSQARYIKVLPPVGLDGCYSASKGFHRDVLANPQHPSRLAMLAYMMARERADPAGPYDPVGMEIVTTPPPTSGTPTNASDNGTDSRSGGGGGGSGSHSGGSVGGHYAAETLSQSSVPSLDGARLSSRTAPEGANHLPREGGDEHPSDYYSSSSSSQPSPSLPPAAGTAPEPKAPTTLVAALPDAVTYAAALVRFLAAFSGISVRQAQWTMRIGTPFGHLFGHWCDRAALAAVEYASLSGWLDDVGWVDPSLAAMAAAFHKENNQHHPMLLRGGSRHSSSSSQPVSSPSFSPRGLGSPTSTISYSVTSRERRADGARRHDGDAYDFDDDAAGYNHRLRTPNAFARTPPPSRAAAAAASRRLRERERERERERIRGHESSTRAGAFFLHDSFDDHVQPDTTGGQATITNASQSGAAAAAASAMTASGGRGGGSRPTGSRSGSGKRRRGGGGAGVSATTTTTNVITSVDT